MELDLGLYERGLDERLIGRLNTLCLGSIGGPGFEGKSLYMEVLRFSDGGSPVLPPILLAADDGGGGIGSLGGPPPIGVEATGNVCVKSGFVDRIFP